MARRWTHLRERARIVIRLAAVAALTSAWVPGVSPAGATASHPGGVTEMCREVLKGAPTGGLKKETEPENGSEVKSGDVIKVKLTWQEDRFDKQKLHKALDCVTIDGDLAPDLSVEERDTTNDGVFEHSYTVPAGLPAGTRVCDRGFVSGPGGEEFEREKSNDVCFTVGAPTGGESAPAPSPPAPPPPPPPPPVEQPPAPPPPPPPIAAGPAGGPVTPPRAAEQAPTPVAGAVQPAPRPVQTLPRTGSDNHWLALFAFAALFFGRLSAAASGRRPASPLRQS